MGKRKTQTTAIFIGLLLVVGVILWSSGKINLPSFSVSGGAGTTEQAPIVNTQCGVATSITYAGVNKLTSGAVTVTDAIKVDGDAPVTSLSAPQPGQQLAYLGTNASYFFEPTTYTVKCGSNGALQTKGYNNATVTLSAYNSAYGSLSSGGGATNVTIGANDNQQFEIRYQGQQYKANMPFGGCLVAEYPSTLTGFNLVGSGITAGCPYHVTHTVSTTSNAVKMFSIPAGFDASGSADVKVISGSMTSGSDNPVGTSVFILVPANYYQTNAGTFELDTEKFANQDTTRTFRSSVSYTIGLTCLYPGSWETSKEVAIVSPTRTKSGVLIPVAI